MKGLRYAVFALFIVTGLGLLWLSLSMRPSPNDAAATTKATTSGKLIITTTTPDITTTATPATTVTPSSTTTTSTPIGTSTPECGLAWRGVTSPNPSSSYNELYAISAVSPNDTWAVGRIQGQTLVEHWDGNSWNVVPSPNFDHANVLSAVDAISANDVWAVGNYMGPSGRTHTLTMHWNGADWNSDYNLDVGRDNFLSGVAAISPNDVWAVGDYTTLSCCYTMVWHWNGTLWTLVDSPNPSGSLSGVAGLRSNDVWAVGVSNGQPFTLHWDGTQLNVVPNPNIPAGGALSSVAAVSSNDVWAVGNSTSNDVEHSLIEHWDGTQWSVVASPDAGMLDGVSTHSPNDVWAVSSSSDSGNGTNSILHWDGSQWSVVPSPNISDGAINDVVAMSADDVWAVGRTNTQTLAEQYNDPCSPHLVGHVRWQGPLQLSVYQQLPITLTLKLDTTEVNYPSQTSNRNGYLAVPVSNLANGTYSWRAKGPKYLANSDMVTLSGDPITNVEIGLMKVGDANGDNLINIADFNITKVTFGRGCRDPGYDDRAEFTGDCAVTIADFNLLKRNFSLTGAPPI